MMVVGEREGGDILPTARIQLVVFVALVVWTVPASGDSTPVLDLRQHMVDGQYLIRHWELSDGLPQNSITDIAQTDDGFLWLTTFGGLVRFDGHEFRTFAGAPTTHGFNPRMTSIAKGYEGALWIGLQAGGVVRLRDGEFENIDQPPELLASTVWGLAEDKGSLLVAAEQGVWVYRGGGWETPASQREGGCTMASAVAWTVDGSGWLACLQGFFHVEPNSDLQDLHVELSDIQVTSMRPDPEGGLWIGGPDRVTFLLGGESWLYPPFEFVGNINNILVDGDGDLWVTGGQTLLRLGPAEQVRQALMDGMPPPTIRSWTLPSGIRTAHVDRERNLWLGTDAHGLWQFGRQEFERYGEEQGLAVPSTRIVAGDGRGNIWVSSYIGGMVLLRDGQFESPPPSHIFDGTPSAMLTAGDGALWVGHTRTLIRIPLNDEPQQLIWAGDHDVLALVEGRDGTIWAGTSGSGVLRVRDGEVQQLGVDDGLGHADVRSAAVGPSGEIWFGHRSGSSRYVEGTFQVFTETDGHPPGTVRALHVDVDGTLWLGTYGGGLARYHDGEFTRYTSRDGLYDDVVSVILDDGSGWLWMNGNRGVFRVRRSDLEGFALGNRSSVRSMSFLTGEGNGGYDPAGWLDGEGRLWFPTTDGVVGFSSEGIQPNTSPPVITVESARVDDTVLSETTRTRIPPGDGDLEVTFTAACLRRPEMTRYRYRLMGRDGEWISGGTQREVRYTNLPAGDYVFEVQALNEDDVPSVRSARLAFVMTPHFHQTWWFAALLAIGLVALGGGVGLLWSRRVRSHNYALQLEIDGRRQAQKALREQEEHYRRIVEAASDGFLLADAQGGWMDVNPAACRIFGYEREELLDVPAHHLFVEDVFNARALIADGRTAKAQIVTCLRGDGSSFEAQILAAQFTSGGVNRALLTVTDISALIRAESEKRELQRQLAFAQRLEALGRLAGGVAHDFNNTLTIVVGNANLLEMALEPDAHSPTARYLNQILDCSLRADRMIRQLLAFGRQQPLEPVTLDPVEVVHNLESMLRRLIRDDVELFIHAEEHSGLIHADLSRAEQAIVNLITNAGDAMPSGGTITVSVSRMSGYEINLDYADLELTCDHVRISVEDTGQGIKPEVEHQIFEPFFTTKPVEDGSGLGLASVHGFVTQSEGHVRVRSQLGEGTRFDIFMPAIDGSLVDDEPSIVTTTHPRGNETVMVCDDNAGVRESISEVLEARGYTVLQASDGMEALYVLENTDQDVAALVTDVVMPEIDGTELALHVHAMRPEIRVLFVSGYASDVLLDESLAEQHSMLSKPFSANTLLQKLRALLDK